MISQLDISRIASFRRTIARAAISLIFAGVALGYWAAAFLVGLLSQITEANALTSLTVMVGFGAPIWMSFRHSHRVRGGRSKPDRLLMIWLSIYLTVMLVRSQLWLLLKLTVRSGESQVPEFVFETVWLLVPAYFIARGALEIRRMRKWPISTTMATAIDLSPWEGAEGKKHPVFLNSRPARLYLYASYIVLIGLFLAWSFVNTLAEVHHPLELLGGLTSSFMLVVILIARPFRRARRHSLQNVDETLSIDVRAPVLYLRSFVDDRLTMSARTANGRVWLERFSPHTFEEVVCDHLWRYGPVVALGAPGERLPPLGAVRNYFEDDQWRSGVLELMQRASVIVLAVGRTEGLQWELERLATANLLTRTLLVVPPVKPDDVSQRWKTLRSAAVATALAALPESIDPKHTLAVMFSGGESPRLLRCDRRDDWAYEAAVDAAMAEYGRLSRTFPVGGEGAVVP